jgi:hypothetical protein
MTCPRSRVGYRNRADLRGFAAANGIGRNDAILNLKCIESRSLKPHDRRSSPKWSLTMNAYVAIVGGKAVLTFRAVDDDQARAMTDDQEGGVRSDPKVLAEMVGKIPSPTPLMILSA